MICYNQKKVGQTKAHEDQIHLDGGTFVFTVDCLGHFHLPHQFPKAVIIKGAKSQVENCGCWGFPGR